ncbi:hypothetical protein Egran_03780 [Elaphomyces granulatus]|uniref:Uncharacterized protein n=1 Tax=Elaphomyces granulatus TaxID=519963 RepID=A0A232LWA1_9EURO|nr:hypothetical protein Egran_03780 [Elaphomyces granulatus]
MCESHLVLEGSPCALDPPFLAAWLHLVRCLGGGTANFGDRLRIEVNPLLTTTEKLESYVSPPLSPPTHRTPSFDTLRGGPSWDRQSGMDGDNHQRKQHDPSSYPMPGVGHHSVHQSPTGSTDRFGQSSLLSTRANISIPAQASTSRLSAYAGYGYTDQQPYGDSSLQSGSLQGGGLQYQTSFSPAPLRQQPAQHQYQQQQDYQQNRPPQPPQQQQPTSQQQQSQQQPQPQQPQPHQFPPYGSSILYNVNQGQAQTPYEVVPPYQPRQTATMRALSQFAVPQYFSSNGQAEAGDSCAVSQYLGPQAQTAVYHEENPLARSTAAPSFSATMTGFNPLGTAEGVEQQQEPMPESSSLENTYSQYQQALRVTFDYTRAGRLLDASRSLLEISEWLIGNARELGILRDEQELHSDRIKLWNNFNVCWLSVCQKQRDMTQDLLETGHQLPNTTMLTIDMMERMGQEIVRLCDKMEPHGLVDYQMGIWEEEILSILSQCLDLLEGGSEPEQSQSLLRETVAATRS